MSINSLMVKSPTRYIFIDLSIMITNGIRSLGNDNTVIHHVQVVIRSQAPLMRGINDDAKIWSEKWRLEVARWRCFHGQKAMPGKGYR